MLPRMCGRNKLFFLNDAFQSCGFLEINMLPNGTSSTGSGMLPPTPSGGLEQLALPTTVLR